MDMNTKNEKIKKFISMNQDIKTNLFFISDNTNFDSWLIKHKSQEEIKEIKWLFTCDVSCHKILAGIENETIYVINDRNELDVCVQYFEDLPYEFLRREIEYGYDGTKDYWEKHPERKKAMLKYEFWCKDHEIELDKDRFYHDENGHLFSHYFD